MAKPIGTLGVIDTLTVGGRVFTDLTTLIVLGATVAANNNATFRKCNGTSGYPVTSAKTLTIYALRAISNSAAAATQLSTLLYADADLGFDSAVAFTTPIYCFGSVSSYAIASYGNAVATEHGGLNFTAPAGKYLCFTGSAQQTIHAFGYET